MATPPKLVQAALLFDQLQPFDLDALVKQFRALSAASGIQYNLVFDTKPGRFYRLYGSNVMVTVESIASPAKAANFETALSSPFTQTINKDARARVARHRSHVLINVHHGVIPPSAETAAFLQTLHTESPVDSTPRAFRQRLALCGELALLAHTMGKASLVHWTANDHLMTGDAFSRLAIEPAPSLLHIHPLLFDGGKSADGRAQMAIKTFGAGHFIDREVHVEANPIPFHECWTMIATFLKVATADKGYIVPDGDTFCDEADTFSCRVRHVPAGIKSGPFDGPLYRLEPLFSRACGFRSPDYVPGLASFDDRSVPADVLNQLGEAGGPVVEEWREKRAMAEGIGGRFAVSPTGLRGGGNGPTRPFGRRKSVPDA